MFGKKKPIIIETPEPVIVPDDKVWLVYESPNMINTRTFYEPDRVVAAELRRHESHSNNLVFYDSNGTMLRSYYHWNKVVYLGTTEEVQNG